MSVPNIPHESVPLGKGEEDNPVIRTVGEVPDLGFAPKEHWELGTALGGLDFECAAKLAGARFSVSFGWCAGWNAPWRSSCWTPRLPCTGTPRSSRRTSSTARP